MAQPYDNQSLRVFIPHNRWTAGHACTVKLFADDVDEYDISPGHKPAQRRYAALLSA